MSAKSQNSLVKQRRLLQKRAEIARAQDAVQKGRVKIAAAKAELKALRTQS